MKKNDVQIAIVFKTRESAESHNQIKLKPMVVLFIKTHTVIFSTHHNTCLPEKWFGVSA
jgi:hypothetical protein